MPRKKKTETTPEEMQEQAVAEELGVQGEEVEAPPQVVRGITIFELEDGQFGFQPVNEGTTLADAMSLTSRISTGILVDMVAQKVVQLQMQQSQYLAQQAQAQKNRPGIVIPGRGVKRV